MQYEKSCGAVVFTRIGGEIKYVLAQSLEGLFGFPKGNMEPGETEEETALREIWEEVHIRPTLLPGFREVSEYLLPNRKDTVKTVVFFLGQYADQEILPQKEELKSAVLVSYGDAMAMIPHANTRKVLQEANQFLTEKGLL